MPAEIGKDVPRAARLLRDGEVVGMPTETVYGLAAAAFDPDAVLRIFEVKERPSFDPLIVHLADASALAEVADLQALTPAAQAGVARLTQAFWPGPLTLVLPKRATVPDVVTSGLDTVAVRVPDHPLARELILAAGSPLAAPSANPFGYISPTSPAHVVAQLGARIPYVLDGGQSDVGVESTIVAVPRGDEGWTILRDGGLSRERIEAALQAPLLARTDLPHDADATAGLGAHDHRAPGVAPEAPGQLLSHYAPRTPLLVGDVVALAKAHAGRRVHALLFEMAPSDLPAEVSTTLLAPSGSLRDAARALFGALREADALEVHLLVAERFPDEGLGRAINDRLRRASAPRPPT